MQSQDDVYGCEDALYSQVVKYFFLMTGIIFSYDDSFAPESFVWRADHFLEEAIEEKIGNKRGVTNLTRPFFACAALVRPFALASLSLCSA